MAEHANKTAAQLHEDLNIDALNVAIWKQARKAWDRLDMVAPDLVESSDQVTEQQLNGDQNCPKDHYWWPRISTKLSGEQPNPIITRLHEPP